MNEKINRIIDILQDSDCLASKQATIGFDGFIDYVVRAVENRNVSSGCGFFSTIEQFGSHLISKKGMSCSIEMKGEVTKIGGNMPILANALGTLGIKVNCVGPLGFPDIHPEFKKMSSNCVLYSIANPDFTTAMEFNDGKIMLYQTEAVDSVNWDNLKTMLGLDRLIDLFQNSDIIGLVNWSEMIHSNSIWEGILHEILPHYNHNKRQIAFFDLADCSSHSNEEILHTLRLIEKFSEHFKVVLSMNENESRLVFRALNNKQNDLDLVAIGNEIRNKVKVDILVIHPVRYALAWDSSGEHRIDGLYIEKPKLSTGGGDNFNAGFCMGQLLELDVPCSLILANVVSGFYVKYGHSPSFYEVIENLRFWERHRLQNTQATKIINCTHLQNWG